MIWEVAPAADFVRPPSSYGLTVRQVTAAIQRSYKLSPKLQGLVDELTSKIEDTVLLEYQNKPAADDEDLVDDLATRFKVFKVWHSYDLYGDLAALSGLLASDFVLWAMPLKKLPHFHQHSSGALWKYCEDALNLFLLFELQKWWNDQANVRKVSDRLYREVSAAHDHGCEFATVQMVEAVAKLPYDSGILRDLSTRHLNHLMMQRGRRTDVSLEQLLVSFPPSSDNLPQHVLQRVYGETPKLLLISVHKITDRLDPSGPFANVLKAIIDWAVYRNVEALIQQGSLGNQFDETLPPIGHEPASPPKPQGPESSTLPGKRLSRNFHLGFRAAR